MTKHETIFISNPTFVLSDEYCLRAVFVRKQALSKALGKTLRFFDAPFVQQANTATDAQSLEKNTIQTEVYITKTEDGSFVAKVECVAKRMSLYHTIKNEFH